MAPGWRLASCLSDAHLSGRGVERKRRHVIRSNVADDAVPRVAVVDDDPVMLRILARRLGRFDVATFERATGLVRDVEAGARFDVIVSDLMMPEMTGGELHAELLRVAPEQARRMVIVTGGAASDATRSFLQATALPVVEKPIDFTMLLLIVSRIARESRRR